MMDRIDIDTRAFSQHRPRHRYGHFSSPLAGQVAENSNHARD